MEVLVISLVIAWFVRVAVEDGVAAVRNVESPRIARQRARLEMARNSGVPTIGQAAAARIATVIAPSPGGQRRHPALEYARARWEDAWDELLESHHEEMRRRAQERRDRQAREAERQRRERQDADDIVDAEVVDRPRCSTCDRVEVDTAGDRCPACRWVAPDPTPPQDPDEQDPFGAPEPHQPTTGWRETTGGAERTGGDAYYRRWEQPHPRGDGTLRTTVTSWVEDDGQWRLIVTETEWRWVSDEDVDPARRVLFEDYAMSAGRPGPSGEPWPTPDDVRRHVDDASPAAPDETPLAGVLDAFLCPGGCGTWVVGGMCGGCETRRALPNPETPEPAGSGQHDPAPDQGPASTTQHQHPSGPAAHPEGTPVPQSTTRIDPNARDASGALRCVAGSAIFTGAVRDQVTRMAANAERGLRGNVPAVQAIRAFEADIAASLHTLDALVEEHMGHKRTQDELAGDVNLLHAAIGYLAAERRI